MIHVAMFSRCNICSRLVIKHTSVAICKVVLGEWEPVVSQNLLVNHWICYSREDTAISPSIVWYSTPHKHLVKEISIRMHVHNSSEVVAICFDTGFLTGNLETLWSGGKVIKYFTNLRLEHVDWLILSVSSGSTDCLVWGPAIYTNVVRSFFAVGGPFEPHREKTNNVTSV